MQNVRPTFLTVLCILTFIGSAWNIYNGIGNYTASDLSAGLVDEQFEKAQERIEDQEGGDVAGKMIESVRSSMTSENLKNQGIATAITGILTLIGAVLMWGLRRTGFYVYLVGAVAAVVAPMFIFGGITGAIMAGGAAFIGILFVVLYALNLKHLH